MTWVNIREKLSKEEIVEVASKDAITSTPIDNVVFDGKEIKRLIRKIDPSTKPKKKEKRKSTRWIAKRFY
jgi:nucleoside diphosphate kinase